MGSAFSKPLQVRQPRNVPSPRATVNAANPLQGGEIVSLTPTVENAAIVVAKVVVIVAIKYLLDMTDSIPLASGFKNVAQRFCESVQSAYENWEAFEELRKSVEESCTLSLHLALFNAIKDSNHVEYAKFVTPAIEALGVFFQAINSVSDLAERKYKIYSLDATSAANAMKRVIFNDIDKREIVRITKTITECRNKIINYATLIGTTNVVLGMKKDDEQLRAAIATKIPNISKVFADDIQRHLENFVPGSRAWLTAAVDVFLNDPGGSKLFWLKAGPGMGKSALAVSILTVYQGAKRLLGFFLCRFDDKMRSNGRNLIMVLAAQIAENLPACREEIELAAANVTDKDTVRTLMTRLIEEPLKHVASKPTLNMLLVIDALDELHLQGSQERAEVLNLLKHLIKVLPPFIKVLVTSRPDRDVVEALVNFEPRTIEVAVL